MLPRTNAAQAVQVDNRLSLTGRCDSGKIEQNPIWIHRGLNRWLHPGAQRNFDTQPASIPGYGHILHGCIAGTALPESTGHQEHCDREMSLNGVHVPLPGSAPLNSRVAACLIHLSAHT